MFSHTLQDLKDQKCGEIVKLILVSIKHDISKIKRILLNNSIKKKDFCYFTELLCYRGQQNHDKAF